MSNDDLVTAIGDEVEKRIAALLDGRDEDRALMTIPEVMERLGLKDRRIYYLIKSGELESVKLGKSRRIVRASVDAYVERHRVDSAGEVRA